ncbi:predicted protein [Lichtheimia corymbifera JMRC:FSU:9682]|uniref:Uncharacterized protein n=1 Tax=Lichtheimia corymbifera JMRC:FSU:9682 TaxID=1263082 RepID=A0A068SFT1_9FUNG|nr:predicted protein [Lichtheimia corymbifera JMRC:FSU:9682]
MQETTSPCAGHWSIWRHSPWSRLVETRGLKAPSQLGQRDRLHLYTFISEYSNNNVKMVSDVKYTVCSKLADCGASGEMVHWQVENG